MGLRSRISGWASKASAGGAAGEGAELRLLDTMEPPLDPLLVAILRQDQITREQAMDIPAFAGCVRFISETVAGLPVRLHRKIGGEVGELVGDPRTGLLNGDTGDLLNGWQLKQSLAADIVIEGGGYAYIRRSLNEARSIHYVERRHISFLPGVDPIRKNCGITVNGARHSEHNFIKATRRTADGVRGVGILQENQLALALAYNTMKYENLLTKTGGNRRGFIKSDKKIDQKALDKLQEKWEKYFAKDSATVMVLNSGLSFQETSATSVEMQLSERKKTQTAEICGLFGVAPAVIVGSPTEAEHTAAVKSAVLPVIASMEAALNQALLLESEKPDHYFRFDTKELLRGSIESRFRAYSDAIGCNLLQIDEARAMEDLPPLGLTFVKLGLQDVLYDPEKKTFFIPNMNAGGGFDGAAAPMGEERSNGYIQDPKTGQMMGSRPGGGAKPFNELMGPEYTGVKGQAAIDKLLEEKQGHVKGAFQRKGIGDIDLIWGDDTVGIQHIIKSRNAEGFDGESFLHDIPSIIRNGKMSMQKNGRFSIDFGDKHVIIASQLRDGKIVYVMTAYIDY